MYIKINLTILTHPFIIQKFENTKENNKDLKVKLFREICIDS